MPVPPKKLNAQTLAEATQTALDPKVKEMAEKIGENIRAEQGEMKGVESFHRHLPLLNMRYVRDLPSSVRRSRRQMRRRPIEGGPMVGSKDIDKTVWCCRVSSRQLRTT